jgi:hypothetical protein
MRVPPFTIRAAIKAKTNPILLEFLNRISEDDRNIFIEIVKDFVFTVFTEQGSDGRLRLILLDFSEYESKGSKYCCKVYCSVDSDGRIERLDICQKQNCPFDLHTGIGGLKRLQKLYLSRFRSLPHRELSELPNLEELCLNFCPESMENFPLQMNLSHLNRLKVYNMPNSRFTSVSGESNSIVDPLPFNNAMRIITLERCGIDGVQLATLLFEMLPSFPNVTALHLGSNEIASFEPIVQRFRYGMEAVSKSKLCKIDLYNNPIWTNGKGKDEATCEFIRAFSTIIHLDKNILYLPPKIKNELLLNRAGRSLVVGRGIFFPLPLSVWPIVLERLTVRSRIGPSLGLGIVFCHPVNIRKVQKSAAAGLFYLLRNGPVLVARRN